MEKDFLPQGDHIRQLLVNASISTTNINGLLRDKGVFLGHIEKNNSIPLLMKTLVSPEDFRDLHEAQKKKEDTIKFRTATIKCTSDFELTNVFSAPLDLAGKIKEAHKYEPNFKLLGTPTFYIEDETAIFDYRIERDNFLENWTSNKTEHSGKVFVKKSKDGNLELSVEQNSTSKETILINELIVGEVKKLLKDQSFIKQGEDFIRIKFKDFTNAQRIQFFYSFTKDFCIYLKFQSITDIDLYLDEEQESHTDIKALVDEIDSLKINGRGLQNNPLLKNNLYHDKLIVASISLKYSFDIRGVKGNANLVIAFPDYIAKRSVDAELQISLNFTIEKEHKRMTTETQLRKELYAFVEKHKIANYSKFKTP
jgi:hypothetical protein